MTAIEDPQLAQVLAETVNELRVLRMQLATAAEGMPIQRRPEPRTEPSETPADKATASPRAERPVLPQMTQAVASRLNPTRFTAEAVAKPQKPLAPRSPSGPTDEPRSYAWESIVKSLGTSSPPS